jgi:two-component system response regulator AtoC
MARLLIVDNDEGLVHFLTRLFAKMQHEVTSCGDGMSAVARLREEPFDTVLLDYKMPGLNGLDTLTEIKQLQVKTPVVVMTAYGTTETAIEAMKRGAYDYVLKPFDTEELKSILADALEVNRLMKEVVALPEPASRISVSSPAPTTLIGTHRTMQEVFKLIGQVAAKDVTVLVTGESGTGKELVARAIYHHSARNGRPFIAVNCACIPDTLFESELFGYERGAFTGADRTYLGKFERCHGGTLFFDEIGDMSLATQSKVLRVLQEGEFERLGGSETLRVSVRLIAATHCDLEKEVKAGRFREDLYYRLRIISLHLPSLRARLDDIPSLVDYFVGRLNREYGASIRYVSDPAIRKFLSHGWPGNVRELENCLRRAVLLCKGDVLLPEHVQFEADGTPGAAHAADDFVQRSLADRIDGMVRDVLSEVGRDARASLIDMVERSLVGQALWACVHNQVHAARMLGISRNTLRHRIKKYQLDGSDAPAPEHAEPDVGPDADARAVG